MLDGRTVKGVVPKVAPCVAYAPVDFDGQVGIVVDVPPEVYKLVRPLYTWPAASALKMAVDSGIPFARKYMISVLASDTVKPNAAHTTTISHHWYSVCVCVFSSHSFWTSSSLDVPAGVTQEEGHTGFLIHLLSTVRAYIFLARRIQPFLSLVDREVEFCVLTM